MVYIKQFIAKPSGNSIRYDDTSRTFKQRFSAHTGFLLNFRLNLSELYCYGIYLLLKFSADLLFHVYITSHLFSCKECSFATQPNLVLNLEVYSSLHEGCRHHIRFTKFGIHVYYPPSHPCYHTNDTFGIIIMRMQILSEKHWVLSYGRMFSLIKDAMKWSVY